MRITYGKCDYCGAEEGNTCQSSGGYGYESGAHRGRVKAAMAAGVLDKDYRGEPTMVLPDNQGLPLPTPKQPVAPRRNYGNQPATTPEARIKLALWYVQQAGGVSAAKEALEVACTALTSLRGAQ